MASLTDVYTQLIVAQADPMNMVVKQMASQQVESSAETLNNARIDTMLRLQKIIAEGTDQGRDISAFQRMLDKYSNKV